ncbi:MAG: hypothetical protein GFH27_549283n307 [Chloroflexi bacterium AL-W]|nr:hypothetical protein [Chloroflexi bacterium AL-N1]NOK64571.1 hypothetical protein [Chloroflexi bacterium AL-N10]NOK75813.1 hypothetical protein [Chloroflexi bacterium AL-N5]NOK80428.1 hypothetical protein [Chloroflexi bacterium AL-W]NOK86942.1 hypothetical protein [Chloroflexi bacterium AL-N15]
MKLTFSVLWFDDNEDYFDSLDIEPLKNEIRSWGFHPKIVQVTVSEDFMKHSPFVNHDLIVVDQNLEGYKDGQEFIADIRGHSVYTEVIFYTAGETSTLWELIHTNQLEGIFVSSRQDVLTKIESVGKQAVRKVLDLENMRGIVMAEVGVLDMLLDTIIILGIKSLPEEQRSSIFKAFHKKTNEQIQFQANKLATFIKNPDTDSMIELCDSNKRWENFRRLKKIHNHLSGDNIGNYVEDILAPRNFLAHGKPESLGDEGYLFNYQGKQFSFNSEVSLDLRQTILKYKKEFLSIIKILENL